MPSDFRVSPPTTNPLKYHAMCLRRSAIPRCSPISSASSSPCRRTMPTTSSRFGGAGDWVAGERGGQVAEEPWAPEAAASDDHPVAAGLGHHAHRVRRLPDVAVAEHGNGDVLLQRRDGRPVGLPRVVLVGGSSVKGDSRTSDVLGDAPGVEIGQVLGVDAHARLHGDRNAGWLGCLHCLGQDRAQQVTLPRQSRSPTLAGDLGNRTAEVEVDVVDAELVRRGCAPRRPTYRGSTP